VKLWGVGNEPWGDWQLGHTSVEQFELKHDQFAKACLLYTSLVLR